MESLELKLNERPSKPQENKLLSCDCEGLEKINQFQMNIFEIAQIAEKDWLNYIFAPITPNLSNQMREYYCLNLCPKRKKCEVAEEIGYVNINIDYDALFLNSVKVMPNRNNSEKPYELFRIQ